MRAFAIPDFNASGAVVERPKPTAGEGQILVRVRAAGVNPVDSVLVMGGMRQMVEHRLPLVPGFEYAGTVEEVGIGVDTVHVGDEVFGAVGAPVMGEGSWAEYVVANAMLARPRPAGLTATDVAALPVAGGEALALVDSVDVKAGDTLLIIGAGGGVGSFLVQLAARTGATILAATRAQNADYVRGLGATDVFEPGPDLAAHVLARYSNGVTAVIDTFHDAAGLRDVAPMVRSGGWLVSPKAYGGAEALADFPVTFGMVAAALGRVGELAELVAGGDVTVQADVLSLEDGNRALQAIGSAGVRGKLVISLE